jgi:hypothetical protein
MALACRLLATSAAGAPVAVVLALLGGKAISAQDKCTVQVPNGLAFSDFRGYENWEDVSETETGIKVIVANPTMMAAYRDGLPADGKHFPDGSTMSSFASISEAFPSPTAVHATGGWYCAPTISRFASRLRPVGMSTS